eukprot:15326455-Ditylum_brightwellii.AAC.1
MGQPPTGLELGNTSEMENHSDTRFSCLSMSSHLLADAEEEDGFEEHQNKPNLSHGATNALGPILKREDQFLKNNQLLDSANSTVNTIYYRTASQHAIAPHEQQQ